MTEKTRQEIDALKNNWTHDPCWDIEETEGFEAHKSELYLFRKENEKEWEQKEQNRLRERAVKLGIPDRIDLIRYFESLEFRIKSIENAIDKIENNI